MAGLISQLIRRASCRMVIGLMSLWPCVVYAQPCDDWPLWQKFSSNFIQPDGRVLADESEQHYSTSEGQAYALFFSLVANQREIFDRLLIWTRDNLSEQDLTTHLPAWQWGKKPDGSWGVADQNSAADADAWLAYTLLQAGRLWKEATYTEQGKQVLARLREHEVRDFQGAGAMLLPAPQSFDLEHGGTRLNPSYVPIQLLRAFAKAEPSGPWKEVIKNSVKLTKSLSPKGYAPDWGAYIPGQGYIVDPQYGSVGSYDAIRTYLWWGMLSPKDPVAAQLRYTLQGMNQLIPKHMSSPPLRVDAQTGVGQGESPPGFSAALLPYFATMGNDVALRLQRERLSAQRDAETGVLVGHSPRYYDQVLALFGQGWMEHRFSFSVQGKLAVQWKQACSKTK